MPLLRHPATPAGNEVEMDGDYLEGHRARERPSNLFCLGIKARIQTARFSYKSSCLHMRGSGVYCPCMAQEGRFLGDGIAVKWVKAAGE